VAEPRLLRRPYQASLLGGRVLILGKSPTRPALVPRETAAAFAQCIGPRTLAEHAAAARAALNLPEAALPDLTNGLQSLWAHGFFAPWPAVDTSEDTPAKLTTLAIPTRNRPEALARCLRSHIDHGDRFGRSFDIALVDSSDTENARRASREVALATARDRRRRVLYIDAAGKGRFADRLAQQAGVAPDIVRFALTDLLGLGQDAGANRNALLLGLAGQAFLSSDDDVVCDVRQPLPAAPARLRLTSRADPTEVRLFETFEAVQAAAPAQPVDLFDRHERLLGRRLTALLAEMPVHELALDSVGPSLWDRVAEGRDRVAVTSSGLLGDSGARYPSFYAWSNTAVKEQLLDADEQSYRHLLESRQLVRAADCPTVTPGPFVMSTHIGLDARRLLPAFSPVFRGQDMGFATLLRFGVGEVLIGHLPEAVLHAPWAARRGSMDALWRPPGPPAFATLLSAAVEWAGRPLSVGAGAPRLRALGRRLRDLASADLSEAGFVLRAHLAESTAQALSRQAADYAAYKNDNRPWVRDLRRQFDDRVAELLGPFAAAASEIAQARPDTAERETLDLLGRFGALLEAWPDLHEAATALVARDQGLFSPL
jgi:hypothetical protein